MDDLQVAKSIQQFLGIPELPKYLMDDSSTKFHINKDEKRPLNYVDRTDDENLLAHFNEDSLFSIKTVRFLKDFYRYRAKPDLQTTNESFLRTAELFRLQGIKNYGFILQLNNPLLIGVDPYDENLTEDQKVMIMNECKNNFWYFLREICRLRPDMKFKANRGNVSFMWNYLNHITTYMIMPRQQGKLQPNSSKVRVMNPTGTQSTVGTRWKRIGDIRTGDQIIDRTGNVSTVIGVHPQGRKRIYKMTFSDGRETHSGAEHLWTVFDKERGANDGLEVDYTTAMLIDKLKDKHYHKRPIRMPLATPEEQPSKTHVIPPYIQGVMLTGTRLNGKLYYTKLPEDVIAEIQTQLPAFFTFTQVKTHTWVIAHAEGKPFDEKPRTLPLDYLEDSIDNKLSLIQGVMDCRGKVDNNHIYCPIPDPVYSYALQYLFRSLGGTAAVDKKYLKVTLPHELNYFKRRAVPHLPDVDNALYLTAIDYHGTDEASCIEVDNEEQIYITDEFIPTHNTVSVQVINFWLTYIVGRGYKSHVITLKSDNRAQFIDAIKRIRTCIPKYLVNPTYRDKDAGTYLTYRSFGEADTNVMTISVPQQGQDAAENLGRGLTVGSTTVDEGSYISFIEAIINGCMPSALTEMENMRAAGLPYCINYITTPNTVQHPSGEFMFDKLMGATEWREKFFDSYSESHLAYRLIKASPKDTTSPSVSMVYNYLQLGKDKGWVKETIDKLNLSLSKAKIDLLLMWTEDGENRLFDDLTREAINNAKRNTVWSKEYRDSGLFIDFFISQEEFQQICKPEHNDYFLVGCDTSSAINKDACTLIIRSLRSGKVIGVGRYPLAYLDDVATIIVDILVCIPNSLLIIERNYAHHMIDNLLITLPAKGLDPFKKIFNQIYQYPEKFDKEFQEVKRVGAQYRTKDFYLRLKQHFGFNTNAKSREEFYGYIQEAVGMTGFGLNYDKLCDELINLKVKGGRIDHDNNRHDDLVVAWLLTYWFIKRGQSKPLYGIPMGISLVDSRNLLNNHQAENSAANDPVVEGQINQIREQITKLSDELMNTNDNILALRIEAQIRRLSQMLPIETKKLLTIDTVIEEARLTRNRRILQLRRRVA